MKKCKGTSQETAGFGCNKELSYIIKNGVRQYKAKYGLGFECRCYSDWLLNTEAGRLKMQKAQLKASKPRRELEEAEKEMKRDRKLSFYMTNTKNAVHAYVKERDKGKSCISCGTPWHEQFQAGHYYKAELYSTIRFHFDNIHGQCQKCNLRMDGNFDGYRERLPKRIGVKAFKELEELASMDKLTEHKWEREKLQKIRKQAQEKIKHLKL